MGLAFSRAVELAEVDPLPCPEHEFAVLDRNEEARSEKRRLQMTVAVSFGMTELRRLRDEFVDEHRHVADDVRVGVFVDRATSRRVRDVEHQGAVRHSRLGDEIAKPVSDFDEVGAGTGRHLDRVQWNAPSKPTKGDCSVAEDFLERIVARKRQEIAELRLRPETRDWEQQAQKAPTPPSFYDALEKKGRIRLIAEIKRASPSAGELRNIPAPADLAKVYVEAGADAVSVLTDRDFFHGDIEDLRTVKQVVSAPLLRKDFVLDPLQVFDAKLAGASAVLFIAECLSPSELEKLVAVCESLQMTAFVEMFDADNLSAVLDSGARVVGVNNRDLRTFETDVSHCLSVREDVPSDRLFVAESGIRTREDVERLRAAGVDAMLIGESLLRATNPAEKIAELLR
jgi:indole-3-glycerol phosphate synthase